MPHLRQNQHPNFLLPTDLGTSPLHLNTAEWLLLGDRGHCMLQTVPEGATNAVLPTPTTLGALREAQAPGVT